MTQRSDELPKHIRDTLAFYNDNYESLTYTQKIQDSLKIRLCSEIPKSCRYCGKGENKVSFKTECHVLLEALGNRRLFAEDECDNCNGLFGRSIENHFGKWSLPFRTVSCVKGKRGFPKMARDPYWRIESSPAGLNISMREDWKIGHVDEPNKIVCLDLLRDPYVPIAVYKTFVRMALALMPREELKNFQQVVTWILCEDHTVQLNNCCSKILYSLIPQIAPPDTVSASLSRRFTNDLNSPYMVFVLCFSNYVFQACLPAPESLQNRNFSVTFSPLLFGPDHNHPIKPKILDLSGTAIVRDDTEPFIFSFESVESHQMSAHENISTRAYFLWENNGKREGQDLANWLEAERQITSAMAIPLPIQKH